MPKQAYSLIARFRQPALRKPAEWVGNSREDLRDLPAESRRALGFAIHLAQIGLHHPAAKQLKGEFRGLVEVVDDFDGNTYRAVYTVRFAGVVYVLHVFQKKSTRGIATSRRDLALIRSRLRRAQVHYAASYVDNER